MKTVEIIVPFTGFPDDTDASRRDFIAGEKPELPVAYADLIIGKGLAREVKDGTAHAPAKSERTA